MADPASEACWPFARRAAVALAGVTAGVLSFYSLVLTPVIFSKIPNPGRGEFLAAIFPSYFLTATLLMTMLLAAVIWWNRCEPGLPRWLPFATAVAAVLAIINAAWTGPLLRDLGEQIRQAGITDSADPIRRAFGKWHGISQSANLGVILGSWLVLFVSLKSRKS